MLTAGALALAVIAPNVESSERPARAGTALPSNPPAAHAAPQFEIVMQWAPRVSRVSRSAVRPPFAGRHAGVRPAAAVVRQAARQAAARERARIAEVRREARAKRAAKRHRAEQRRAAERKAHARELRERATEAVRAERSVARPARTGKRARKQVVPTAVPARMAAVVRFARAQVGKRYARGAEGPNAFDCSGFTKRAYAQIGIRLPHSSGGQAARARAIPRWAARPGDLVVGPGHVGVYMGRGMMIDAGNRRTGVVYRKLYAGLRVERL